MINQQKVFDTYHSTMSKYANQSSKQLRNLLSRKEKSLERSYLPGSRMSCPRQAELKAEILALKNLLEQTHEQ